MIPSFLRPVSHCCRRWFCVRRQLLILTGIVSGIYLVSWIQIFSANFGTTLTASTALGLTLAMAVALAAHRRRFAVPCKKQPKKSAGATRDVVALIGRFGLAHCGLAVWAVIFPWLMDAAWAVSARIPIAAMASTGGQFAFLFLTAVVALALPLIWLVRLPAYWLDEAFEHSDAELPNSPQSGDRDAPALRYATETYLLTLSLGILLNAICLAPFLGLQSAAFLAAVVGCFLFLLAMIRRSRDDLTTTGDAMPVAQPAPPTRLRESFVPVFVAGCLGLLLTGLFRMIHQLMLVSSWLIAAQWAFLIIGIAIGRFLSKRALRNADQSATRSAGAVASIGVALWSVCLVTAFGKLVNLSLTLNAFVEHVWLMQLARGLLVAVVLIPVGIGWGATCVTEQSTSFGRGFASGIPQLRPLAAAVGYFLGRWFLLPSFGVAVLLIAASWLLLGMVCWRWLQNSEQRSKRLAWAFSATAVVLLVAGAFWRQDYDPARSAKLLFDTNAFIAHRLGQNRGLLPFLDEGRLSDVFEGDRGTYTIWKYRGSQLQIRENGVPKAIVSTDPSFCPDYSPEVLVAAMPLVLHERPHRVLLLGLSGGIPLTTCLSFPVPEITCVEPDRGLIRVVKEFIAPESGTDPLSDDLVRLWKTEPALAVACRDGQYDVILSCLDQPALLHSVPYCTVEFYKRVARRLSPDGIFCQRIQHVDIGAATFQNLATTLLAAFSDVVAVEVAAGEMLLLGTNSPEGIARGNFVERFQAPHVRAVLSQLGWDWSVLLNLPAYDRKALAAVSSKGENSSLNGRLAFHMPLDVMRWAPKLQEVRTLLARHTGRVLMWAGTAGEDPDVSRRMDEVNTQKQLMGESADEYWTYRKAVKEQVTRNPRSLIQLVSHSLPRRRLHPEVRRRMRYFKSLSVAVKHPSPQNIETVASFQKPYDPLISYFVHQEAAELYSRCQQCDVERQFAHRLHAIYFASSSDLSVRNVSDALKLLTEHPDAVPDPLRRWDHLNGLLQTLKSRWYVRASVEPESSPIVLNDIEQSISAVESSFKAMDELVTQTGLSAKDWLARRKVIEQTLIRPLRTYRTKVLPHHYRRKSRSLGRG